MRSAVRLPLCLSHFVLLHVAGAEHHAAALAELRGCCIGHHVKFGAPPADFHPLFQFDGEAQVWSGFLIESLDEIANTMGFTFTVVAAPPFSEAPELGEPFAALPFATWPHQLPCLNLAQHSERSKRVQPT